MGKAGYLCLHWRTECSGADGQGVGCGEGLVELMVEV